MGTALRRELPEEGSFDWLPSSAFNGGIRFEHQWSDRSWALWGFLAGSHVRGDEEAITRIQRASNHYFQRPDATRFGLDPSARSMTGAEWRLQLERRSGDWTGAVWAAEVTKGFEINDAGFSGTAERVDGGFRVGYQEIQPGRLFRNYSINLSSFHNWSHEAFDDVWSLDSWQRARTNGSYNLNANAELSSFWRLLQAAEWPVSHQYLLYPNPWPKPGQLQRRWHGHPVFPTLLATGGWLELRSNWPVYVDEFSLALQTLGEAPGAVQTLTPDPDALTPFERKYTASGHTLWQVLCNLTKTST
jgi:hypothetical protein